MYASSYIDHGSSHHRPPRMTSARRLNSLTALSTMTVLAGLLVAAVVVLFAETPDQAFANPAPFLAVALAIAAVVEARAGLRNLVRVDLFMLAVLYLLTFFEFLLPQAPVPLWVTLEAAQTAVHATLLGFAGIVCGRHLFPVRRPLPAEMNFRVSPRATILILVCCAFFGYLYMLLAVNFNILEMLYQMSRPRFSQPWTRGRYGSLSTLLNEVGSLKYVLPPLTASVFAYSRRFTLIQKAIAATLLALVLYDGFASGTRNIFLTYLMTFIVTYILLLPRLTLTRFLVIGGAVLVAAFLAISLMLRVRTVGLREIDLDFEQRTNVFIDMALVNFSGLTQVFPSIYGYLGTEVPYIMLIRPIPRAIWPGKPEGLSVGIEAALGVGNHMTLSASFLGELWMSGGYLAIIVFSLAYGGAAAAWNRRGAATRTSLGLAVFGLGFFPAGLGMRSFLSLGPTFLPIIAAVIAVKFFGHASRSA